MSRIRRVNRVTNFRLLKPNFIFALKMNNFPSMCQVKRNNAMNRLETDHVNL